MNSKLRIRDDDVLMGGFDRFKKVHEAILKVEDVIHVPAILTTDLSKYPEAVNYIFEETCAGRMIPELHGEKHIDYAQLEKEEVVEALKRSMDWMLINLQRLPTKWYTPWGANADHLYDAAEEVDLELIDCTNIIQLKKAKPALTSKYYKDFATNYKSIGEVMIHFWESPWKRKPDLLTKYLMCIVKGERLVIP